MQATCSIETDRLDRLTTRISMHYRTPEWGRVTERGTSLVVLVVWGLGTAVTIQIAALGAFDLSVPKQIVLIACLSALFYVAGFALQEIIRHAWRQGRGINVTVDVVVTPSEIVIEQGDDRIVVPRHRPIVFAVLEHRDARHEQREEQRVGHPLGYAFRDAFDVWLQCGHQFELIAAVADEASARAIVRHLQDADTRATRGDKQHDALARRLNAH